MVFLPNVSSALSALHTIPPVGTSAHKAMLFKQRTGQDPTYVPFDGILNSARTSREAVQDAYKNILGGAAQPKPAATPSAIQKVVLDNTGGSSAESLDYLYADLAKYYGFDKATAYQEALANTQYSRSVADMKRAGLNPAVIFGAGRGSTAPSFIHPTGGFGASGGGSSSYRRTYSSGSSKSGNFFSPSAYSALSTLGGLIGIAATGKVGGYFVGSMISQGAMSAVNVFHQARK